MRLQSPEAFGSFGRALTQFGSTIVVGANELDIGPHVRVGSAYVFDGATGAHLRTLRNPSPTHFGWFGFSMEAAADNFSLAAGPRRAAYVGLVYVYGPNSSTRVGTLANPQASNPNAYGFGFALKEHNGDLFVSAVGGTTAGQQTGAIYRYDGTTLTRELTIAGPTPQLESQFGRSLYTNGSVLLAGEPGLNVAGVPQAGGAYLL